MTFLFPKITYEPSQSFAVGRASDYQPGEMKAIEARRVFIFLSRIKQDGQDTGQVGFQAVSMVCTHLGCSYKPYGPSDNDFPVVHAHCPCHGSIFDRAGNVLGGPAPRPLAFYHMELAPDGRLIVDMSKSEGYKQVGGSVSGVSTSEGIDHRKYLTPDGRIVTGDLPTGLDALRRVAYTPRRAELRSGVLSMKGISWFLALCALMDASQRPPPQPSRRPFGLLV